MNSLQLREEFLALGVILPDDREIVNLRNLLLHPTRLYLSAIFVKLMFPCIESPARLEDSLEVTPVALQNQCLESSKVIQESTHTHYMSQLRITQILIKHG